MSYLYASSAGADPTFKCNFHCQQCFAVKKAGGQCSRMTCKYLPYCHSHMKTICGLVVAKSGIKKAGDGLFAVRDFKEGEVITVYYGEKLTTDQRNKRYGNGKGLSTYGFTGNKRVPHSTIDGACYRSSAVFANDLSISSNADARASLAYNADLEDRNINMNGIDVPAFPFLKGSYLCVVATKDISVSAKKKVEIHVDYGKDYWREYPSVTSIVKKTKVKNPTHVLNPVYSPNNPLYDNPIMNVAMTPAVVASPALPASLIMPGTPGPAYVPPSQIPALQTLSSLATRTQPSRKSKKGGFRKSKRR